MSESPLARPRRTRRRRSIWLVSLFVLVLLAAGGWFARQVLHAKSDLQAAAAQARVLKDALAAGDRGQARDALVRLQASSRGARASTGGVLWRAGSHLPAVGDDLAAVRTVSAVLDDLSRQTLPPVVDAADSLDVASFRPHHGRLAVAPLRRLAPVTGPAQRQVAAADARVRGIDTSGLLPQLQGPVAELQDKLDEASSLVGSADTAARLLPSMLGGNGPRHYLVVFQNNAEVRATGGLPGAYAVVTADHGRISLGRQGALSSFPRFAKPVLPLTSAERGIYTDQLGVYAGDTTLTPDFPRAAQLAREMWRRVSGQQVDGVLSADPVALSYLLGATGPVDLGGGRQLTADNAVPLLLHDAYLKLDPAAQDRFFAAAAGKVFAAVSSGKGDPRKLLSAITRGVDEGRILVWSAHDQEQSLLAPTAVSGALPSGASGSPHVGLYLNDATGAKMDYYLDYRATVRPTACTADGRQTLATTLTLRSTAPADAAKLPDSVTGPGLSDVPRGWLQVKLDLYAPVGGTVRKIRFDGKPAGAFGYVHDGRRVKDTMVLLRPGQKVTVTFEAVSGTGQRGDVHLDVTPGAHPGAASSVVPSGCS